MGTGTGYFIGAASMVAVVAVSKSCDPDTTILVKLTEKEKAEFQAGKGDVSSLYEKFAKETDSYITAGGQKAKVTVEQDGRHVITIQHVPKAPLVVPNTDVKQEISSPEPVLGQ